MPRLYMTRSQVRRWRRHNRTGWLALALAGLLATFLIPALLASGRLVELLQWFAGLSLIFGSAAVLAFRLRSSVEDEARNAAETSTQIAGGFRGEMPSQRTPVESAFPLRTSAPLK